MTTTSQKSIPHNITRKLGCDREMASQQPTPWHKVKELKSQQLTKVFFPCPGQANPTELPWVAFRIFCPPMTKAAHPTETYIFDLQLGSVTSWVNRPVVLDTKRKNTKRWLSDHTDKQICLPISRNPKSVNKSIVSPGTGAKMGANPTKSCSLHATLMKGLLRSLRVPWSKHNPEYPEVQAYQCWSNSSSKSAAYKTLLPGNGWGNKGNIWCLRHQLLHHQLPKLHKFSYL